MRHEWNPFYGFLVQEQSNVLGMQIDKPSAKEVGDAYREFSGEEVSLWHFPMMNDAVRNDAYDRALGTALEKNKGSVLDIGTGSGLLALMAARHGASRVTTCETIPVIANKARKIIEKNGYADRIKVVDGYSTHLKIGSPEAPEKFDILVTEIFDDGLLGEHAFKAIGHARENLLKPDAQIIPAGVRVMAMGIESTEIFKNYRVSNAAGFDVREFNEFSVQGYVGIHLDKMAYRPITKPMEVFNFDFKNIPSPQSKSISFEVTDTGTLHAIAFWFELALDSETRVSSGPGLPALSSWKQAVQVAETADGFKAGDQVVLLANHDDSAIWFTRP